MPGINWEIGVDIYTLLYIKQINDKGLRYSILYNELYWKRLLKSVCLCVYIHLIHFSMQQKLTQHYKQLCSNKDFLVAQLVKNPPAMRETWVRSLGWEDTLEKEMAIHSSILAQKISWTEEPGGLQPMGLQRVGHD